MKNNINSAKTVSRISTLEEHRALLRRVLTTAKNKVLIVSPFIASSALKADGIPALVNSAARRGVCVDVYTDDLLNRDGMSFKKGASSGMASLVRSGAHVHVVNGIHNKTLARDEDLIAEGSFNWLSAVRARGAEMQREERTLVVEGEEVKEVKEMIQNEFIGLNNLKPTQNICGPANPDKTEKMPPIVIVGAVLITCLVTIITLLLPEDVIRQYIFYGVFATVGVFIMLLGYAIVFGTKKDDTLNSIAKGSVMGFWDDSKP